MAGPPRLRALSSLAREAAVRPGLREDKIRRFNLAALLRRVDVHCGVTVREQAQPPLTVLTVTAFRYAPSTCPAG
jgi:hypothetical protein